MNSILAQIGQLASIVFKFVLILTMIKSLSYMDFSFWTIGMRRARYLVQVFIYTFTSSGRIPDEELNDGYLYLQENKVYKWMLLCLFTQFVSIFALMDDYQSGQYQNKSAWWFISSPGQSLSFAMIIVYLFILFRKERAEKNLYKAQANSVFDKSLLKN